MRVARVLRDERRREARCYSDQGKRFHGPPSEKCLLPGDPRMSKKETESLPEGFAYTTTSGNLALLDHYENVLRE